MKQIKEKLYLLILIVTMCLPLIGSIFDVKQENAENRQLQKFPAFSEKFTIEFEQYWQDQFPFRNQMITLYNQMNQSAFGYSGNHQVILGKEGMLFFSETLDEFQNSRPFSQSELLKIQNNFNLVNRLLEQEDVNLYLMVVPNKNTINSELMPDRIHSLSNEDNYDNIHQLNFDFEAINLKEIFLKQTQQIYHQLDSHTNNLGAALISDTINQRVQDKNSNFYTQSHETNKDFVADLTTMLYPSSTVYDENQNFNLEQEYVFVRPLISVDDLTIQTLNPNQENNLYFIRDSFGRALIPFVSNSFNKVQYSRISPYYFQEAVNLDYKNVLVEIAERNMFHWLKLTPVIASQPIEFEPDSKQGDNLVGEITQERKHQLEFLNIKLEDQDLAKNITKAYIVSDNTTYEMFTIYNSNEFENRDFDYGLSIYTNEKISLEYAQILYQVDGQYYRASLVSK